MRFNEVDPTRFIDQARKLPANGRGAWTKTGKANNSYRYEYIEGQKKVGNNAGQSLDAWATCIGSYGYQKVLIDRGYLGQLGPKEQGLFGPKTVEAVKAFQDDNVQVTNGRPLAVDGTIGMTDAKALLTPLIDAAEKMFSIPNHYLRGETNLESALDCGALGYYIYYGDKKEYRGVDRGCSQINSAANPQVSWEQAFDPFFCLQWSAERMKSFFTMYQRANKGQSEDVLWDAALCAHNNPSAAGIWAKNGFAPTDAAATYVANAKNARY